MNKSAHWRAWKYSGGDWSECDSVSIADRGFRYGMSIFETIAVRNTKAFFVPGHLTRLLHSVERLGWEIDPSWKESLGKLFSENTLPDGVVRIFITAGEGGPIDHPDNHGFYALWEAVPFPDEGAIQKGIAVCQIREFSRTGFTGMKTGNYWGHIHALQEARRQNADECLIFDARGALISAAMANVFIYRDGKWFTPSLESGARDGVVREWMLQSVNGREEDIYRGDLQTLEEMVLVNSRIGIMPVRRYDEKDLEMRRGRELAAAYLRDIVHA